MSHVCDYIIVIAERKEPAMSYNRIMKYNKNGFDIIAKVFGAGEGAFAHVLYKPYGEDKYINIGKIFKTTTAACGTNRDALTWHHVEAASPINKKSWHEAAKDLFTVYKKQ